MNRLWSTPRRRPRPAPGGPPAERVRSLEVWRGRVDELCLMALLMSFVAWAAR